MGAADAAGGARSFRGADDGARKHLSARACSCILDFEWDTVAS